MVHLFLTFSFFGPITSWKELLSVKYYSYVLLFLSLTTIKSYGLYYSVIITIPFLIYWLFTATSKRELSNLVRITLLASLMLCIVTLILNWLWDSYLDYHEIKRSFNSIKEIKFKKISSILISMQDQIIEKPYHLLGLII